MAYTEAQLAAAVTGPTMYKLIRDSFLAERGTVGMSPRGVPLPRLTDLDRSLITGLIAPFMARAITEATPPHPQPVYAFHQTAANVAALRALNALGTVGKMEVMSWMFLPEGPSLYERPAFSATTREDMWTIPKAQEVFNPEWQKELLDAWNRMHKQAFRARDSSSFFLSLAEVTAFCDALYDCAMTATSGGVLRGKDGAITTAKWLDIMAGAAAQTKTDGIELAKDVKAAGEATIKGASEVAGETAAWVADTTGDVAGRFFDSFFSNVGIWGVAVLVAWYVASSHGVI